MRATQRTRSLMAILSSFILTFGLVACGGGDETGGEAEPAGAATPAPAAPDTEPADTETEAETPAATAETPTEAADGAAAEGERVQYTVGYSSTPGIGDLGTFLTWDELRSQGIDVETQFFSDQDVVIQALARGDIDFATNLAAVATMNAIEQGVPLQIFTGYTGAEFVLSGTMDIQEPEDLEGTTTAVHSEGGQTWTFMQALIEKYDLQDVEILIIPNSSARREALAQGQLDTAPLDLADAITIAEQEPDTFHTVLFFGEEFPVANSGTSATEEFLSQNSEDVQTIVNTMMETYRRINEEPEWAAEQAPRFYGALYADEEVELLKEIVRQYAERDLWPPDLGISEETAQETIEFNTTYGDLSAEGTVEDFYDFTFVNNALEELGTFSE